MRAFFLLHSNNPDRCKKICKKVAQKFGQVKKKHYLCTVQTKIYDMADKRMAAAKAVFLLLWCQHRRLLPNTLCVSCNGAQSMS